MNSLSTTSHSRFGMAHYDEALQGMLTCHQSPFILHRHKPRPVQAYSSSISDDYLQDPEL